MGALPPPGTQVIQPPADESAQAAPSAETPNLLVPFLAGLHFGVLQVCLFLAIQVGFTATYLGYFAVVLAWMVGVVFSLRTGQPRSLTTAVAVSLAGYAGLLGVLWALPPHGWLVPVLGLLVALAALPAGRLFGVLAPRLASGPLFLHENNGFVLGSVLAVVAFVQWGIHALAGAPLLTLVVYLVGRGPQPRMAVPVLLAGGVAAQVLGGTAAFFVLLAGCGLAMLTAVLPARAPEAATAGGGDAKDAGRAAGAGDAAWSGLTAGRMRAMLLLAGFCLMLLQALVTREFSNILSACELSILVVGTAYFAGLSVGYGLLRRVPLGLVRALLLPTFLLHAGLLVGTRPVAGWLIREGHGLGVLVGLLFLCAFLTSSLYSMLLPRLIALRGADSLVSSYIWDLVGAAVGVTALLAMAAWMPALVWPAYLLAMAALVALMLEGSRWRGSFLVVALAVVAFVTAHQRTLGEAALADSYRAQGYGYPGVVFSGNSFYHSVDIVDTHRDVERTQKKRRQSFINGVQYFSCRLDDQGRVPEDSDLSEFTSLLAELPARTLSETLGRPLRILIMGCGSMHTMQAVEPYSRLTTMVEIDPLIVEAAKIGWADANRWDELDPARNELVVDDARHYLMTTDEQFDLVVMDISAPYYLGTSLLHGREFFELVREHLLPGGVFSESTQSPPDRSRPDSMAMRILGAAAAAFPDWRSVATRPGEPVSHGFVYGKVPAEGAREGARDAAFTQAVNANLRAMGWAGRVVLRQPGDGFYDLSEVVPFSLTNMDSLLTSNEGRIRLQLAGGLGGSPDARKGDPFTFSRAALHEVLGGATPVVGGLVLLVAFVLPFVGRRRDAAA